MWRVIGKKEIKTSKIKNAVCIDGEEMKFSKPTKKFPSVDDMKAAKIIITFYKLPLAIDYEIKRHLHNYAIIDYMRHNPT